MNTLTEAVISGDLSQVRTALECADDSSETCNQISTTALLDAMRGGFKSIARTLIEDARFDAKTGDGELLRQAIILGYLDLAGTMIDKGAPLNRWSEESGSAMLLALDREYFSLAQHMIAQGAEVSIREALMM